MNKEFQLDTETYFTVFGFISSGLVVIYFGTTAFKAWYAVKKSREIRKPDATSGDWQTVERYAQRQVIARCAMFIGALILFALFWLNAFVWFNSIQISDNSLRLGFLWGGTRSLERSQVTMLHVVRGRRGGHLEIATRSGKHFRSVRVKDPIILSKIEDVVQSK